MAVNRGALPLFTSGSQLEDMDSTLCLMCVCVRVAALQWDAWQLEDMDSTLVEKERLLQELVKNQRSGALQRVIFQKSRFRKSLIRKVPCSKRDQ